MEKAEDGVPSSSADGQANAFPRMQHLFVMRHGDRLDDADHNWIFKAPRPWDPPITDVGKRRARRVGQTLRHQGLNITRVICSPFLRCVQTASEVIIGLCSLDSFNDDATEVAIDPSKVKAFLQCIFAFAFAVQCLYFLAENYQFLFCLIMADTSSSSDPKSLFEIRRFDGTGFDLWKDRMQGILFLKDCDGALSANKPEGMSNADWTKINRKAVTYIKMAVTDDILPAIKGLDTTMTVWDKLKASYENTTPVNQIHLMRKLVSIEYGLCEVMNSYAIRVPQMPPTGPTIMELDDLEALLPAGTMDATVPKLLAKLPDWRETLDASHKRYVETFQAIADMFPGENVLCVTHGEGVSVSVTHHQTVTVYQVRYCAISHLQRPIHNLATPPAAGPFEFLTEPGDVSGLSISKRIL
ncbi:hypothetical protein L7F22_026517 [Adiantum nelumboides]|nr:hypothetical protein [Adiantum nelumboides]